MENTRKWFALTSMGSIVLVCECDTYEQASESAPADTVWMFDEASAPDMRGQLVALLAKHPCAHKDAEKDPWFALLDTGEIAYIGEFADFFAASDSADTSFFSAAVWILHRETATEWLQELTGHLDGQQEAVTGVHLNESSKGKT